MTNDTFQPNTGEPKSTSFGALLKTTREAQGLERKDVAAQLRLNENVIAMLESDDYTSDLPPTFIRGYMRSYGKLLQIPEREVLKALEIINPTPIKQDAPPVALRPDTTASVTSSNYFVQFFTYLIALTMIGLVGTWWYTHNSTPNETQQTVTTAISGPGVTAPLNLNSTHNSLPPSISSVPLNTGKTSHPIAATQAAPPSHAEQGSTTSTKEISNQDPYNSDGTNSTNNGGNATGATDDAQ